MLVVSVREGQSNRIHFDYTALDKIETIQVKGEVTKFNASIMERNWIHLQDGTEFEGKYDLTITSQEGFQVGQVVTIKGIVALNRDFGYGYNYAVLLEEATTSK